MNKSGYYNCGYGTASLFKSITGYTRGDYLDSMPMDWFGNPILHKFTTGDILEILMYFVLLSVGRVILVHSNNSNLSLLLRPFRRIVQKGQENKFSLNLWYAMWHLSSTLLIGYMHILGLGTADARGWSHHVYMQRNLCALVFPTEYDALNHQPRWPAEILLPIERSGLLLQIGFWISSLIFYTFEKRRKDFKVMCAHHVTTILLLIFGFSFGYFKLIMCVLIIHDPGDICLYGAKALLATTLPECISISFFAMFSCLFFLFRLLWFPYIVFEIFTKTPVIVDGAKGVRHVPFLKIGCFLMTILIMMHVYWFKLIVQGIIKMWNKEEIKDDRSDDEDSVKGNKD